MRTMGCWLWTVVGCSVVPVSALIRSPIDSKCQSFGLKGCPELVDGTVAYAEGDKPLALTKLERARSLNTPAQMKQFADAVRIVGEASPGDVGRPLLEVATLLSGATEVRADVPAPLVPENPYKPASATPSSASREQPPGALDARRPSLDQFALYALTARTDPQRLVSETVWTADAPGIECQIAEGPGKCVQSRQGPLIVTDVVASGDCAQRVFLVATDSDSLAFGFSWLVPARADGIHGGNFFVAGYQWLFVAIKPPLKPQATDRGCFVTFSGFRPRLVPALAREANSEGRR